MSDDESTLTWVTEDLPTFVIGEPYEQQLEMDGGMAPYTFAIESGEFPTGIYLTSGGMVSGTPSEPDTGDTTVFITGTDDDGTSQTQAFDCEVKVPKGGGSDGEDEES